MKNLSKGVYFVPGFVLVVCADLNWSDEEFNPTQAEVWVAGDEGGGK